VTDTLEKYFKGSGCCLKEVLWRSLLVWPDVIHEVHSTVLPESLPTFEANNFWIQGYSLIGTPACSKQCLGECDNSLL